jgi:hypothetical protein
MTKFGLCVLGQRIRMSFMYYHAGGAFLGILLLISSGEFLEACFDKIDEFRQRDTSQLAAGLFIPLNPMGSAGGAKPGLFVLYRKKQMARSPETPQPGSCRQIIRHDKKDQAYTILVEI